MNNRLVRHIIQCALHVGVREFCIAAGKRNAPFVYALANMEGIKIYFWPEERSAAFFALGRTRSTNAPVAVITTSGSAAAELLPAAMEAYYTHQPLLLITADRPRSLRGSGAPQSVEQVGLFSYYARYMQDVEGGEECNLHKWGRHGPAHLNICLDEPIESVCEELYQDVYQHEIRHPKKNQIGKFSLSLFEEFIKSARFPLVVLGALGSYEREAVVQFLLRFKAPVYAEGPSGLREDPRLAPWRVGIDRVWQGSAKADYPVDGVLRIGSIPTGRIWRDLDDKKDSVKVCSICELPFSGLSWADGIYAPFNIFYEKARHLNIDGHYPCQKWIEDEKQLEEKLIDLFHEEPKAEASQFHHLSQQISTGSLVYLGNSLPVREWDLAATYEPKNLNVTVSRGVCGIDGQISTFLGLSSHNQDNWALIGDLTAVYDMAGPWIMDQLPGLNANLVVVNNGGGQIFSRMFSNKAFLNGHQLSFGPLADFWKWKYERWEAVPQHIGTAKGGRLIEIVPDPKATERFLNKYKKL